MSEEKSALLSPVQRRVIAAGATALAAVFLLGTAYFCFELLRRFVSHFQDVLLPLAVAAILATLLRPIITFCEERTRLNRVAGIALLYLLVVAALATLAVYIVPALFDQAVGFAKQIPELLDKVLAFVKTSAPGAWEWLRERLGEPPDEYVKTLFETDSEALKDTLAQLRSTLGTVGGFFGGFFGKIAAYAIVPVYLFFILNGNRDVWGDIKNQLSFLPESRRDDLVFLARQFSEILVSFFRGQIVIGLLLGVVLAAGFGIVGLKFGILLGFVLGLLNIIPYLGTMIGILTVLPLAYFQDGGGLPLIGLCAVVFVIGQLLTDYVFTPRVMGGKTGMGPMLIIFSVFFWGTALGGLLGMILAIPLTAFFLVFWRLAREKYLPALTDADGGAA